MSLVACRMNEGRTQTKKEETIEGGRMYLFSPSSADCKCSARLMTISHLVSLSVRDIWKQKCAPRFPFLDPQSSERIDMGDRSCTLCEVGIDHE